MTVAVFDEVVTVSPAPRLTVVRDGTPPPAPAAKKKSANRSDFIGGDPLVAGAARLLSVPVRHVYAALWRVGLLEVQA